MKKCTMSLHNDGTTRPNGKFHDTIHCQTYEWFMYTNRQIKSHLSITYHWPRSSNSALHPTMTMMIIQLCYKINKFCIMNNKKTLIESPDQ